MTDAVNVSDLERRSQRYWNADGLPEVVMGLLWVLWGGASLFGESLPGGAARQTYGKITPFALVLVSFAATWFIQKLKARFTFPRTGYVAWNESPRRRVAAAAVGALVAVTTVALIVVMRRRTGGLAPYAAQAFGVLLSLGFAFASVTQRAPHLLALAAGALAIGLLFGAIYPGLASINWMLLILGSVLATVGLLRLRLFLKRHPLEAAE